jgi:O-antigen ligase
MAKPLLLNSKIVSWVFNFAILITIYFDSKIQDPFNSPKFWILLLSASWLLGHLVKNKVEFSESNKKFYMKTFLVIVAYLVFLAISSLLSYNKQVSFLGETFRRNGALTYTGFAIFFLVAAKFIRFENIKIGFNKLLIVGLITSAYAFVQLSGNDFVQWSDHGSSVITTLGNSNFAGASMAIFLVLIFGQVFIKSFNIYYRILASIVSTMLLFAIFPTNARQALIILSFGLFLIIATKIYELNKRIGLLVFLISGITSIFAVLGTLQVGPLKDLLYKPSISIRGYYWRAGMDMFRDHPLFGVGVDNYGAFFKEYRDPQYALNYGYGITSSNAHNVFIQNFATGGLFVGALYILLQALIMYKGLKLIKNNQSERRFIATLVFIGWLSFQAQSFISIDNIGISIWGWILGGTIIGLSFSDVKYSNLITKNQIKSIVINWPQMFLSGGSVLLSILLIIPLYSGEKYTWLARGYFDPNNTDVKSQELFKKYSDQALNAKFINNDYKNVTLSNVYGAGYPTDALYLLSKINKKDYRNLDTLILLAVGNEQLGKLPEAVKYRNEISKFDPWNASNYFSLGLIYKKLNDSENMNLMLNKIQSFASSDPISKQAAQELVLSSK